MKHDTHSYALTLKRRLWYYGLGVFFVVLGFSFITASLFSKDVYSRYSSVIQSLLPLICFLTVGVYFIAISFVTKVTTSVDGIEYHTPLLTVSAHWQHLHVYESQESGKYSLVIVPAEGKVSLRTLTKIVPWFVCKDVTSFSIDSSHFSTLDGHQLEAEINAFRVSEEDS